MQHIIGSQAHDFILKTLKVKLPDEHNPNDPDARMTWSQTISHPFITSFHHTREILMKIRQQRQMIQELRDENIEQ